MANIVITVDTENKTLSTSIDGKNIPNMEAISIYSYRDSDGNLAGVDVSMNVAAEEVNGVRKYVSYYAYGSVSATEAVKDAIYTYDDIEGFVGVPSTDRLSESITKFIFG